MKRLCMRIVSVLLMIALLLTIAPQFSWSVLAAGTEGSGENSGTCGENLRWSLSQDGTLTISGSGPMADYASASDAPWYTVCASVQSLQIGEDVTTVGDKAFCYLSNLTAVTIPAGVNAIGSLAFHRCSNLSTITFLGLAPTFENGSFTGVTATVYYPCRITKWLDSVKSNYGGNIMWESNHSYVDGVCAVCQAQVLYSGDCGTGLHWSLDNLGTLTISGSGAMEDYTTDGKGGAVTPWASHWSLISDIVIKNGVTAIGKKAFYGLGNLNRVTIAGSVATIGTAAFFRCINLNHVNFLEGVTTIQSSAFGQCGSLISLSFPESVTTVEDGAFSQCLSLMDVTFSDGITTLGSAFEYCLGLTSVTFLGSAPDINYWCFDDSYATIYYPCDDPTWTDDAKKISVERITWNGHIFGKYVIEQEATCTANAVARGTCAECGAKDTVEIPGTATGHDFDQSCLCKNCGEGPSFVVSAYENFFSMWYVTIKAYADGVYVDYACVDGVDLPMQKAIPYQPCKTYTFTLENISTYYNDYEFFISLNGKRLVSASYLDRIAEGAVFYTVESASVHNYEAYNRAPGCEEVGIIGNVCTLCGFIEVLETVPATGHNYIDTAVLATCTTPGTITSTCTICDDSYSVPTPMVGHKYVDGVCVVCEGDKNVEILYNGACGESAWWQVDNTGTLTIGGAGPMYDYSRSGLPVWYNWNIRKLITDVEIESGITAIGNFAFYECDNVVQITIPENATCIGEYAFANCDNLKTVIIPDSVTQIGEYAFAYCYKLTTVTIPDGVTVISEYAFYQCMSLVSITIPDSVTSIERSAFVKCTKLISVTIPAGVTSIGDNFFNECTSLDSVTFLGTAPTIGTACFDGSNPIVYYPCGDDAWTKIVESMDQANIMWQKRHNPGERGVCAECGTGSNLFVRMVNSSDCNGETAAIRVYADGEPVVTASIPGGSSYQTAVPYYHGTVYTFQWISGSDDSCFSYEIIASGKVLSSGEGADCTEGQVVYTLESIPNHQFETVVTPPTCTKMGTTMDICHYCGYSLLLEATPATGHSCDELISPPTCTESGVTTGICTTCGYSGIIAVIPATGHSYERSETLPTCTEEGSAVDTCSICGYSMVAATLPATGHHYDQNGQCVDCGSSFELLVYMTDTYGDGWNGSAIEVYISDTLLATVNLQNGILSGFSEVPYVPGGTYTLKWKSSSADQECGIKITLNGDVLTVGQGSSYSDGQILCSFEVLCAHVYERVVTPPTCTEKGFTTEICTTCGYSTITETTPATGHHYENGWCSVCGREEGIAHGTCGENLKWYLYDDGRLVISGTGPMTDYEITEDGSDPNTPWYEHRLLITKVVIENGATTIGAYALHGCTNLTEITMPESVTTIGKLAFYNCAGLTQMVLPKGVTTIGSAAFRRCSGLTAITLPEGLTGISKILFFDCTALTEITLPTSVKTVEEYAFGNCTGLTTITFTGSAPKMDGTCFKNVTATAVYPCDQQTWTDTVKQSYGGVMTWEANHSFGEYIPDDNATCTADGTTTRTCSICSVAEVKILPGTATGHTAQMLPGCPSTCTETGLTDGVKCSQCHLVLVPQQELPATGHTEEAIPGVAPTCTQTGLTEGVKCAVCHEVLTPQEIIPLAEHDYQITEVSVTCTDYGYDFYQCRVCGDSFYNRVVAPLGHRYENGSCILCGKTDFAIGDISRDGQITVVDVAMLYAHVKGTTPITDKEALKRADVTGDDAVNIADVSALYIYVTHCVPVAP